MSSIWVYDVQRKIYSRVKGIITDGLKSKYPDLFVTDSDEVPSDPKFPTVYIHFLQPAERGQDVEGNAINAIYLTAEVDVSVTKEQGMIVCSEVSYAVLDAFKDMGFTATVPAFQGKNTGTKRMVARYARVIGYNDTI